MSRFRFFLLDNAIYFVLIGIIIYFVTAAPSFLSVRNVVNISRQVSINGIIAIGMTFAIISGGIDLSVGSIAALSGIVLAYFSQAPHFHWELGILMAVCVSAFIGLVNGLLISKFRIVPFIQTLAMMTVARGLTFRASDSSIINNLAEPLAQFGNGYFIGLPYLTWMLFTFFLIGIVLLNHTHFGKYVYAVGGNEQAAINSGIRTSMVKTIVYVYSGLMSGIAGICLTARVASGIPHVGQGYELDAIAAVVIGGTSLFGGKGSLWGTLVGVLLIGILNNGLDLAAVEYSNQLIIKGMVISMAVLLDSIRNK